ncbi:MAG: hypothetical protein RBS68_13695 [Anaerolineales bacterium]|jgi:hypothetical protein|nr:hypothetical protein [Anaerolineales bacterium]
MMKKMLLVIGSLLVLAALVTACGGQTTTPEPAPVATEAPAATAEPSKAPEATPTEDPAAAIQAVFAESGHADGMSEAFAHWNKETEIPMACAQCHSPSGFLDFVADGKVDAGAPVPGQPLTCDVCHSDVSLAQTEVTFPSGATISAEKAGASITCLNCHQGRASKATVDQGLAGFGEGLEPDAVPAPYLNDQGKEVRLGFSNIHYYAAAVSLYGSEVQGGYQYDGKSYDIKNSHVDLADSCVGCHNQHSLKVELETCAACHGENAADLESLKDIREPSSAMDYDGDGDMQEGVYYEIEGLQETLYASIQTYAREVNGDGIVYDAVAYPYWFVDADGDGVADQADGKSVGYSQWTPRLVKAVYNYQTSKKDPGAFAHGGKYIIELLFDSIEDVNASEKLTTKLDLATLTRNDAGHFDGSAEAWRHWDMDAEGQPVFMVEASCAKCHTSSALPLVLAGQEIPEAGLPAGNGLMCTTCHDASNFPALYVVNEVTFPSGKVVSFGEGISSNTCLECHQGRESKMTVDNAIANFGVAEKLDEVVAPLEKDGKTLSFGFKNIHYFPAGVTIFGSDAQGAYEYDGNTYVGLTAHPVKACADCHNVHALEPDVEKCAACHGEVKDVRALRMPSTADYDGDGDTSEGVYSEIDSLRSALYAAMQKYSKTAGSEISYNPGRYPYFFNAEGKGYSTWTPRLLKAAYNYQYAMKDPGGYVHNSQYVAQILIDSIADLGGDVSKYVRP